MIKQETKQAKFQNGLILYPDHTVQYVKQAAKLWVMVLISQPHQIT